MYTLLSLLKTSCGVAIHASISKENGRQTLKKVNPNDYHFYSENLRETIKPQKHVVVTHCAVWSFEIISTIDFFPQKNKEN